MRNNSAPPRGVFALRAFVAFALCAVGCSLGLLVVAIPPAGPQETASVSQSAKRYRFHGPSEQRRPVAQQTRPSQSVAEASAPASDVRVSNPATLVPGPEQNLYEPVIAINPRNPDNLIAFASDLSILNTNPEAAVADRAFRSIDGGKTWTDLGLMHHPNETGAQILGADPMTVFGKNGIAYFVHMFRPANEFRYLSVYRSTDGGATWGTPVDAVRPERDLVADRCTSFDKDWLSVGSNPGELLLVYTGTTFRCSLIENDPSGLAVLAGVTDIGIYLTRSSDEGQTWSTPQKVRDGYALGAIAQEAPDGTLYVATWAPVTTTPLPCPSGFGATLQPLDGKPVSAIVVASSRDNGATWNYVEQSQCSYDLADDSGVKPGKFGGGNADPSIWIDSPSGNVYVAYPTINPTQNRFTILVISSGDRGVTWSSPMEATPGSDDARMPAIVARNGILYLAYVASRSDNTGDTMLRQSSDGGRTWSEPMKLSSASAQFGDPNGPEIRDYIGMDIVGDRLAVIWTDVRNGAPAEIWSRVVNLGPLLSVKSRKTHDGAGVFDVDLPLTGTPGIECRSGGVRGDYTVVFTFANPLVHVDLAGVYKGTGHVSNHGIGSDPHEYIVNLTGVTNAQTIGIGLTNVSDLAGHVTNALAASMDILLGDTNADGSVNSADIAQTKSQSGKTITSSNFREDVTIDGSLNSGDIAFVKSKSGTALP